MSRIIITEGRTPFYRLKSSDLRQKIRPICHANVLWVIPYEFNKWVGRMIFALNKKLRKIFEVLENLNHTYFSLNYISSD